MSKAYSVDILINDKPITTYLHEGDTYVEGRPNSNYKIRVINHRPRRAEIIVSVDGLSVMDGEPASEHSKGYIVAAYGTLYIDGWRTSDDEVRVFKFGSRSSSYAGRTGNDVSNIGVIGVMYIPEKVPVYDLNKLLRDSYSIPVPTHRYEPLHWGISTGTPYHDPMCYGISSLSLSSGDVKAVASASPVRGAINNVGTEMGEVKHAPVKTVYFDSDATSLTTFAIYYDDRKGLESRGIIVDPRKLKPSAFPASTKYCKVV